MEYTMKWVNGHIEVFDARGRFVFSADTEQEARHDLRVVSYTHLTAAASETAAQSDWLCTAKKRTFFR